MVLTSAAFSSPATDQMLLAIAPITQGPDMVSATTDGPTPHLSALSPSFPTGSMMAGPTPQITLPDWAGDRKAVKTMSPRPVVLPLGEVKSGWVIMGAIVRVMRFQLALKPDRDHGLDIEDVLRATVRTHAETGVVLERHADQVGDRVLRLLR